MEKPDIIYLVSSDGHRDSITLQFFATSSEEIKQIVLNEFSVINYLSKDDHIIDDSFRIDFVSNKVYFDAIIEGDIENYVYTIHPIKRINRNSGTIFIE